MKVNGKDFPGMTSAKMLCGKYLGYHCVVKAVLSTMSSIILRDLDIITPDIIIFFVRN